jgi:hypothetical protein
MAKADQLYVYRWRKYGKSLTGRVCRVIERGKMNSVMVEFIDNGDSAIVSRYALRKVKDCGGLEKPK